MKCLTGRVHNAISLVVYIKRIFYSLLCALCLQACAGDLPGEQHTDNHLFYYPTELTLSPDGTQIFVVSSNFDQRFYTGWVTSINVQALFDTPSTLQATIQLKIPALGGPMVFSQDGNHAYVAHRGTGLVTTMSAVHNNGSYVLDCGDKNNHNNLDDLEKYTDCDRAHLLNIPEAALAADPGVQERSFKDPYALLVQPDGVVLVGYLGSSFISTLIPAAQTLQLQQSFSIGNGSISSLLPSPQGPGFVIATSRQHFKKGDLASVYHVNLTAQTTTSVDVHADMGGHALPSGVFSPDNSMFYMTTHHHPDGIAAIKVVPQLVTTFNTSNTYQIETITTLRLVQGIALNDTSLHNIVYISRTAGDLVVVASTQKDTLYFFSPQGDTLNLVYRLKLQGQGPYGLLPLSMGGRSLLCVTTFFDHGLSIVDVTSNNVADFQEILHVDESAAYGIAQRFNN